MKTGYLSIILLVALILTTSSCAKNTNGLTVHSDAPDWQISRDLSYHYEKTRKKKDQRKIAILGIYYADKCIEEEPKNPACYYYRAVNTGLFLRVKISGYQKSLQQMVKDSEMVIKLDPTYESGGAYRILGMIYTEVPPTSFQKDAVRQDLEKALELTTKAVEIGPDHPENYIAISKTYLKMGNIKEAELSYNMAVAKLYDCKDNPDYALWKNELKKLKKRIDKQIKDLQS